MRVLVREVHVRRPDPFFMPTAHALVGLSAIVLAVFGGSGMLCAGQAEKGVYKELVQYIRDAARLGLKEPQIEHNAVKAGWPADAVKDAMAQLREPAAAQDSTPATIPIPEEQPPAMQAAAAQPGPDEYRIGAGDVLQISVWKEPEASVGSTVVRPDGKIGMPLLKEVEVVGMTPREAEKAITEKLSKLIPAADVTVVVAGINSKKIYMVGAVKKEGPIPYTYRMTVMQALSEGGGLNDYAKRKKIYILRTHNGKDYKLPFDYEAVLKGERMELNIPLLPGDTVVVPH
jgi:polysaccharide export outer membrane protein